MEKEFLSEGANAYKIELNEVYKVEGLKHTELNLIGESNLEPIEAPLRRSDRVSRQSDGYYDFLIQNSDPIKLDENDENPIIYIEAMQRSNFQK